MTTFAALRTPLDADSRIIAIALLLLVIALLRPTLPLPHDSYDYVVVFDISQSMNVEDYELDGTPVSRLAYARDTVRRVLRDLPCGSRIGWGAFTGYRTVLLLAPVETCANYADLLASLEKIDGRMRWSNASEITKGLYWAVLAAQATDTQPNVIFLTDGQEAPPLDPVYPPRQLEELKGTPIRGWLIGTGSYTPSPIPRIDEEGRREGYWRADEVVQQAPSTSNSDESPDASPAVGEELSGLREAHLRTLARQLGFEYTHLTGPQSLLAALRNERFARRQSTATDLSWLPLGIAVALLAIRFRPELRRRPRRPAALPAQK
ncbi:MAG TPA: vWA domain-containing protein [Steroidobacteraceae bacterium]|jgi:mxaL protein